MQSFYVLALRNLATHRLRTALSILAVALGGSLTIASSIFSESVRKAILTNDEFRTLMGGLLDQIDPIMGFMGVVVMLAAGFLVFNAFGMSITARRQEIGGLRALGVTRSQIMRLALVEALIVGLSGSVLGVLGGPLLGAVLIAFMRQIAAGVLAFADAGPTPFSVALAGVLGLGVSLLAMFFPARRAARIPPLAALREPDSAGIEPEAPRRAWIGLALAGCLFAYLLIAPPGQWVTYPLDAVLALLLVATWVAAMLLVQPAFIGWLGNAVQKPLARSLGATGRLISDNFRRGRGRVTLTVLTLMVALAVIAWTSGFLDFMFRRLIVGSMRAGVEQKVFLVSPFNPVAGWEANTKLNTGSVMLTDDQIAAIQAVAGDRAVTVPIHYVVVPELSLLGSAYFSIVTDPDVLRRAGNGLADLTDAQWQTALPILRSECGALVLPTVAARNNVGVGDTLTLTGPQGPIPCRIAGITRLLSGASIIGARAGPALGVKKPILMWIMPNLRTDPASLERDLGKLKDQIPTLNVIPMGVLVQAIDESIGLFNTLLNGMLLLAILAAALGVVNTTVMSVSERQREFGLLRAVGTTRRQTLAVITGEAALIGLAGGVLGLVTGIGACLVFIVTFGTNGFGITAPLWPTAWESARLGLGVGSVGLLAAPIISAIAAYFPARRVVRAKPIETLAAQ